MQNIPNEIKLGKKLYEGKAKILYDTQEALKPELLVQYFKDDATAFNAQKKGTIQNKGIINNEISSRIFQFLEKKGIPTHFVKKLSEREMLVRKVKILPIEVVLRNIIAGSLAKRTGLEEGTVLKRPIIEFYYKDDALGDPMINEDHIQVFGWATKDQVAKITEMGHKVNELLVDFFKKIGIKLVDFKLEFGTDADGKIFLADEVTPDGCRLWDSETSEKLDKDRFRRDLGKVEEAYERVLKAVQEVTR